MGPVSFDLPSALHLLFRRVLMRRLQQLMLFP